MGNLTLFQGRTAYDGYITVISLRINYTAHISHSRNDLYIEKALNDSIAIDVNWIYDEDNDNLREDGEDFKIDYEAVLFTLIEKSMEE